MFAKDLDSIYTSATSSSSSMEAIQFSKNLPQSDAADLKRTEIQKNNDPLSSGSISRSLPEVIAEKKSRLEAFNFSSVRKVSEGFNFRINSSQNAGFSACSIFGATLVVPPIPASSTLSSCSKKNPVPAEPSADEEADITSLKSSAKDTVSDKATNADISVHISNTMKQSANINVPEIPDTNSSASQPPSCNIFSELHDSVHRCSSNPGRSDADRKRSGNHSVHGCRTGPVSRSHHPKLVKPLKSALNHISYKEQSSASATKNKMQLNASTKAFPFNDMMAKTIPRNFNFNSNTLQNSPSTSCSIYSDKSLPSSNILALSNQASSFIPPQPGLTARDTVPSKNCALSLDFKPSVKTENTLSSTNKGLISVSGKNLGSQILRESSCDAANGKHRGLITRNPSPADTIRDNTMFAELSEDLSNSMKVSRYSNKQSRNWTNHTMKNKPRRVLKANRSLADSIRDNTMFDERSRLNLNNKNILNASTAPLLETSLELKKISNCHDSASTSTSPSPPFSDLVSNLCSSMEALRFSKNLPQSSASKLEKDATSLEKDAISLEKDTASLEKDATSLEKGAASLEKSAELKAFHADCNKTLNWDSGFSFGKPSLEVALKWKSHPSFDFVKKISISEGFNFGTQRSLNIASDLCFIFTASANEPANRKSNQRRIKNYKNFSSSTKKNIQSSANQASTSATSSNIKITLASTVESMRFRPTIEHLKLRTNFPSSTNTNILSSGNHVSGRNFETASISSVDSVITSQTKEQLRPTTIPTNQNPSFEFSPAVTTSDSLHHSNLPSIEAAVLSAKGAESNENKFSLKDAITNVPTLLALEMELNEERVRKAIEKYTKKWKKTCYTLSELADAVLEDGTSLISNCETSVIIQPPNNIEQEIRKLKEDRMCKICMENEVQMLYYPCGHLVACERCAFAVRLCPICRSYIKKHIRAFL